LCQPHPFLDGAVHRARTRAHRRPRANPERTAAFIAQTRTHAGGTPVAPPACMDVNRFRISPAVRASASADGLVLLDVHGGLVLSSNLVGARIWELATSHDAAAIARMLALEYDIPFERARRDVDAFLHALQARGLLLDGEC
jgi:hypothetical protein